jgi:hypothetical protein
MVSTQHILPTSTINPPKINIQGVDDIKSTPVKTYQPQPRSHRHWWEDFREGISFRKNSNVSPVQQQSWNDFKHDMYLHTMVSSKSDPYGFTSAGSSREATPNESKRSEDLKHNVTSKAGDRLEEKNQYEFTFAAPSRQHTPALPSSSSGQARQ